MCVCVCVSENRPMFFYTLLKLQYVSIVCMMFNSINTHIIFTLLNSARELCDITPSLHVTIPYVALVSQYTLGVDTLHDMAYMT